jgi:hypothetical protein
VKVAISFICGALVCGLLLIGAKTVIPTRAETDDLGDTSENVTQSFIDLLPDIEAIYRESLLKPFEQAESKIYDEDIAEFYRELLDSTGLRAETGEEGAN